MMMNADVAMTWQAFDPPVGLGPSAAASTVSTTRGVVNVMEFFAAAFLLCSCATLVSQDSSPWIRVVFSSSLEAGRPTRPIPCLYRVGAVLVSRNDPWLIPWLIPCVFRDFWFLFDLQDQKVEAIFSMFDFDGSRSLNSVEIEILIESCVNGMAKVMGN
jgi:hypothetical protein